MENNFENLPTKQDCISKRVSDEISVIMAADKKYAPYLGVTIKSIIENSSHNKNYTIYILDGGIERADKIRLNFMQTENIKFVYIAIENYFSAEENDIFYIHSHFSLATYFRFFIPQIFKNFEKVLYCDCDGVFLEDVANLYDTDIKDYWLGAVRDALCIQTKYIPKITEYFNNVLRLKNPNNYFQAGVLLFNINELKNFNFKNLCIETLKHYKDLKFLDQCVLNISCENHIYYIDNKWNVETFIKNLITTDKCFLNEDEYLNFKQTYENPKFIHFCGVEKPWKKPQIEYSEFFWHYARLTPFYEQIIYTNKTKTNKKIAKNKNKSSNIFHHVFSINNENKHKVITLLGIKFKFKRG